MNRTFWIGAAWIGAALGLAEMACTLSAAEVWAKDWKDWSAADTEKVLNNSPWSAKATASFEGQGRGASSYPAGSGRGGGGGWPGSSGGGGGIGIPGGGAGGGWPGSGSGRGRPRDTGDETQSRTREDLLVRWESALPVREAFLKKRFGNDLPKPGDSEYRLDKPEKDYVISVSGLRPSGSSRGYNSDDGEQNSTDHMRNILMSSTQLLVKTKGSIDPTDVKIEPAGDGTMTARFLFPRAPAIDLDDKEVVVSIKTAWMKMERKFKLKDMVVDGKLAL